MEEPREPVQRRLGFADEPGRGSAGSKRSLPHRRRMGYAYQQTFRSQEPRDDLAPGFLSRRNQQLVALRLQFRRGFFNIRYIKFDPRLWNGKTARPLIRAI